MMDSMNADKYNVAHELLLIYLMLLSSCCDCYPFHVLMPFDKANLTSSHAFRRGIPTPFALMEACGSVGSRIIGVSVATGLRQPPSYITSTGV